mmetsp:Transcript_1583/g.5445  ORF Transcript_1583/g.5445 Transcript_1583/m.5445 type:complete len:296 (+) Transcript_1583:113-1000(+)
MPYARVESGLHEEEGERCEGGFNFDLARRNQALFNAGHKEVKHWKTGTTICGCLFDGGVMLAADTRSTMGDTVGSKNCEKIHYIAPNIMACGAGTAADTEHVTAMVAQQLELHRYATGRGTRVNSAMTILKEHLFKYQGHIGAALVLGGYDVNGPVLYTLFPHGSSDCIPFGAMGSGSLNAISALESGFKDGMTREEAMELCTRAIRAGIYNDLGSGSNVDLCVITKGKTEYLRGHQMLWDRPYTTTRGFKFPPGYTTLTKPLEIATMKKENFPKLGEIEVTEGAPPGAEAMVLG